MDAEVDARPVHSIEHGLLVRVDEAPRAQRDEELGMRQRLWPAVPDNVFTPEHDVRRQLLLPRLDEWFDLRAMWTAVPVELDDLDLVGRIGGRRRIQLAERPSAL